MTERVAGDHKEAEILRLRARVAELEAASAWRLIETAPRNGTKIDAWSDMEGRIPDVWFERGRWVHFWIGDFDRMETTPVEYPTRITHWRPLPLPPPPEAAP